MADWSGRPQRSWIPDGRDDVTEDWVTSLLASHFGDGVSVENFRLADSQETVDHCRELVVEFDCSFDAPGSREMSPPPLSALLEESLVFTACVDEDEDDSSATDHTVIQELESVTLPEGTETSPDEDIELLITSDVDGEGAAAGGRRPSFFISDSDEEAEAPLPALVSYPASGGPSPRAPSPADSESDDQVPDKHFIWTVRLPTRDPFTELLSVDGKALDREMTLFSLVAPRVADLCAPSCVYCEQDCANSRCWVLVIEDPRRQGQGTLDPRKPLTASEAAPIVDALATNAALFLVLRRQLEIGGKHISDEFQALRPSDLELGRHPLAADHAGQCLRELAQLLSSKRPELSKWLLSKVPSAMTAFLRLSEADEELGVPVNGLCCPQNLHLGDEGVLMLDWHLFRYAGLTFDLAHLLLTSTPLDSRCQMASCLLRDFIRRIREKLEEWEEAPVPALTEERVRKDFEQSRGAAFFWAATDLCRRIGRMSGHSPGRRRSGAGRNLCKRGEGKGVVAEDLVGRGAGEVGGSVGSAGSTRGCRTRVNLTPPSTEVEREITARDPSIQCAGTDVSRENSARPAATAGRESDHEAVKEVVGKDGCASEDKEVELRDVLLWRLEDMVMEMKELDVL